MTNFLCFETVYDLNDPDSNLLPFIFHEKDEKNNFEQYFCILNISNLTDEINRFKENYLSNDEI